MDCRVFLASFLLKWAVIMCFLRSAAHDEGARHQWHVSEYMCYAMYAGCANCHGWRPNGGSCKWVHVYICVFNLPETCHFEGPFPANFPKVHVQEVDEFRKSQLKDLRLHLSPKNSSCSTGHLQHEKYKNSSFHPAPLYTIRNRLKASCVEACDGPSAPMPFGDITCKDCNVMLQRP